MQFTKGSPMRPTTEQSWGPTRTRLRSATQSLLLIRMQVLCEMLLDFVTCARINKTVLGISSCSPKPK